ncbi:holin [Streptomyces sp. NPDC091377]|uniref:holin n=1 Tax=Streptomyces sp. NPDC091377 TaxID=3365995 RepID=UPI00381A9824
MFTAAFWRATSERTVRTVAQTLVATLGLDTTGVLDVDWGQGLALGASAGVLTILTALAVGTVDGPGRTESTRGS